MFSPLVDKVMYPEAEWVGAKFVETDVGGSTVEEEDILCLSNLVWKVLCAFAR